MCDVFEVSRSGFHAWSNREPSQQQVRKEAVQERILFHFHDSETRYGSPKITRKLHEEKIVITERTVSKYMKELNLRACVAGSFKVQTTDSNHDQPIAPNILNQNFVVLEPNKVWAADITYIPCREGRLFLASILDLCTREIVGWRLGRRMTTDLVLGALEDAYQAKKPGNGLIHHSDRGSQYASKEYRNRLSDFNMQASMSRKGNCYDNACIESFHSVLKKELVYQKRWTTREQAHTDIYRYIEFFYNRKRIHSALGYLSPNRFAEQFIKDMAS